MTAAAAMPSEEEIARVLYLAFYNGKPNLAFEDQEGLWRRMGSAAEALFAPILAEKERVERNRDMWKGQCERQAKTLFDLRMQMLADEGQSRERG